MAKRMWFAQGMLVHLIEPGFDTHAWCGECAGHHTAVIDEAPDGALCAQCYALSTRYTLSTREPAEG